jgi:hypothetical protein
VNLIQQLNEYNPRWRYEIATDPIDAAIEIGLIEPEDVDPEVPEELNFHED